MKFMAPKEGEVPKEKRKGEKEKGRSGEKRRAYSRTWNKIVRSLHKTLEHPSKARNEISRFVGATT